MAQVSKQSLLGGLCSERNTFLRAAGARRVRTKKGLLHDHFYAKTVPTTYRTPKSVQNHPVHTRTTYLLLYRYEKI